MTIANTYSTIVNLIAQTSGITTCNEEITVSIPEDGLPYAQVLVGDATWNEHAIGLYRQQRTYTINVYVRPVAEGIEPDEGYKACLVPLYNLGYALVTNPTLGGVVDSIGPTGRGEFRDSGVRTLTYAGRDYYGFTITLEVVEKAS